jgi:hypothetical protein
MSDALATLLIVGGCALYLWAVHRLRRRYAAPSDDPMPVDWVDDLLPSDETPDHRPRR